MEEWWYPASLGQVKYIVLWDVLAAAHNIFVNALLKIPSLQIIFSLKVSSHIGSIIHIIMPSLKIARYGIRDAGNRRCVAGTPTSRGQPMPPLVLM